MKWNKVLFCIGCGVLAAAGVPAFVQAREVTVPVYHVHDGSSQTDGKCYEPVYVTEWESVYEAHREPFDAKGKCSLGNTGKAGEMCMEIVRITRSKEVLDHYEVSCARNASSAEALLKLEQSSEAWSREIELRASCQILSKDFVSSEQQYIWNDGAAGTQTVYPVSENGTYTLRLAGEYTHTAAELTVRNIDNTAPTIQSVEVTADSDKKTSLLTVTAEDKQNDGSDGCGLAEQPYSWDNGRTWQSDNTKRVTENGVYQVLVRDRLGNRSVAEAVVNTVAVSGPTVLYENRPSGWTNGDVMVIVTATKGNEAGGAGTGLHEQAYSWDEGQTWSAVPFYTVKSNTTKTVWVRDKNGNITKQKIKVSNIDKSAPSVTLQAAQTEWIVGETTEIVLTAEASDADSGLAHLPFSWDGGKTWSAESSMRVQAAGTYQVIVKDEAGNVSSRMLHLPEVVKKEDGGTQDPKDTEDKKDDAGKKDNAGGKGGAGQKGNTSGDTDTSASGESQTQQDKTDAAKSETLSGNGENKENEDAKENQTLQGAAADKKSVKKTMRRAAETPGDEIRQTLYRKDRSSQDGKELQGTGAGEADVISAQTTQQNTEQSGGEGEAADSGTSLTKEPRKGGPVDWKQAAAEAAEWFLWVLAILVLLCFFVLLLWFFFTSAEVYTKDRKGKEKLLGRCMVYKKKDGYMVRFGQGLYEKSETGEFIIVFQSIFADMAKGSPLLVKSGDRTVKAVIREETRIQI